MLETLKNIDQSFFRLINAPTEDKGAQSILEN